jgi:hypothetical protein
MRGFDNAPLPRLRVNVCASTAMYGKRAALQREVGRRCAAGELREDSLKLECHPQDRYVYSAAQNLVVTSQAPKFDTYLKVRAAR